MAPYTLKLTMGERYESLSGGFVMTDYLYPCLRPVAEDLRIKRTGLSLTCSLIEALRMLYGFQFTVLA